MATVTTRITNNVNNQLSQLANETDRKKGDIIRKAIENYLNEKSDILIAMARIERGEETISLEDLEDKYGLED